MVYRDPADIEEQRRVEDSIEAAAIGMEVAALAVIARRLGNLEGKSLAEVYASMPSDIAEIREIVNSGIKNIQSITEQAMREMAKGNDEWARVFYEAVEQEQVSALNHRAMREVLERETKNATEVIAARCRSSVIEIVDEGTGELLPIESAYKQLVSQAAAAMTTGTKTGQEAISQAVRTLSKSGLRVVYSSGATRNLYSAVSMNVMDAYRVAMGEMREIQGLEFGADGVEVSAHALSAPDHEEYQGRQYSYTEFEIIQGSLSRPLETGANCGHVVSPIILGVSQPKYSESELIDLQHRANKHVTVTGLSGKKLSMSRYDASQYQRKIETSIRGMNEQAYLLEQANLKNFAAIEKSAVKERIAQYKRISKEAELGTRMERTRAYVQK